MATVTVFGVCVCMHACNDSVYLCVSQGMIVSEWIWP